MLFGASEAQSYKRHFDPELVGDLGFRDFGFRGLAFAVTGFGFKVCKKFGV